MPDLASKALLDSDTPFHPRERYTLVKLFILSSPNPVLPCFHAIANALYSAWMSSLFSVIHHFRSCSEACFLQSVPQIIQTEGIPLPSRESMALAPGSSVKPAWKGLLEGRVYMCSSL